MGLRGPGSKALADMRADAYERIRVKGSWEAPGLSRVQRVVKFIQECPITKGIRVGEKMKLLDDQYEFLAAVYGRDGDDRVRLGIKSAPRGNGKTGLAAVLSLCHLLGPEAERRGEVYSAAKDRLQAAILFQEMEAICYAVPAFAERVNILRTIKRIEVTSGPGEGSIYEALSADARRAHGISPTLWVYDELAQAVNRELLDNLQTAMGKRKQSLGLIISTQAPDDTHPLSLIIDDGIARDDPSIVVHLLAAPADADPWSAETIRSVNPAIGQFLNEADIMSEAARARAMPAFESAFRNLRLNQRVDSDVDERLCSAAEWKLMAKPVDRRALKGQRCYAALDLSAKHDLTSLTLVFPDRAVDPTYDVLNYFWTPRDALDGRGSAERERFDQWIKAGWITAVPGPVIRFNYVAQQLVELAREFDIQVIGYDRWRIEHFISDLADIDPNFPVPLEPFGMGRQSFTPAIDEFVDLAKNGRLRHGGNPVLTACVVHAVLKLDHAEGKVIDKPKSRGRGPVRVDGAVTLCMALELAKRYVGEPRLDINALVA